VEFVSRRYLLISPCRDEAEYLQTTIDAVAAQTVRPTKWLIVDDGSKDETPKILAEAAQRYPFIQVVRREDRGHRSVGPGVIDAFYHGLAQVELSEYDYVCKFDCDLDLPPRYFERTMEHFERDQWLGTLSGKLYLKVGDELERERTGDENSVGPVKFYRTACFQDIGGFVREVCWDGIDGHMCRMHGWVARSVDEPDLRITHLRQMGSSHVNLWTGRKRWGRGKYFMGSTPYYVAAVGLYRMLEKPYVLSGLGILVGYVEAMLKGAPRMDDPEYLAYLRDYERQALLFGKSRTAAWYHEHVREHDPKTLPAAGVSVLRPEPAIAAGPSSRAA
jgi:glycosyltransferase involved in cell wall biosynthesis